MSVKQVRAFLVLFAAAALSLLALKFLPIPFLWVALAGATVCLVFMRTSKTPVTKAVWLNLAVVAITMGAAEVYSWRVASFRLTPVYSERYWIRDAMLGVVPIRGRTGRGRLLKGDQTIYDVAYTIGSDRLRISPPGE